MKTLSTFLLPLVALAFLGPVTLSFRPITHLARNERLGSLLNVMSPPRKQEAVKDHSTTIAIGYNTTDGDGFDDNSGIVNIETSFGNTQTTRQYDWRDFLPKGGVVQKARWLITGASVHFRQSDVEMRQNLASLARMLILLREYEEKFGVPDFAGPLEQREVLADIVKDLYGSGTPTWVLETVMQRVTEGMTGSEDVQFMLLPNRAFISYPSKSSKLPGVDLIRITSGYDVARLGAVEQVAVRLASFASNTKSTERLNPASFRMPHKHELLTVERHESQFVSQSVLDSYSPGEDELAEQILNMASSTYGLFFFLNSAQLQKAINATDEEDRFWELQDSTRDTFTRLATREASKSMDRIHSEDKQLYPPIVKNIFRILSSAGACGLWFGGSLPDMVVSGLLAVSVAKIVTSKALAFEERILTEVVASWFVGLCAGMLALRRPDTFCFGAIAVGAVMDFMQGFKVVYAVIEVMSKNTVTGTARLLEGILKTGLISYSLKFGLDCAFRLTFGDKAPLPQDLSGFLVATHGTSKWLFPLLLPLAATAWSGLFRPSYADLPLMVFHCVLAYTLNWAGAPLFMAAACVTFSAGIISRFTGKEALGNTLAGLYALAPGTYMVSALLSTNKAGFVESVLFAAISLGLGGWTGTILCSPTILGKSSGLHGLPFGKRDKKRPQAMLYF